ncbi:MAG: helix-turn-helix transcriptional regulator, partial [Caulobacter sp.]
MLPKSAFEDVQEQTNGEQSSDLDATAQSRAALDVLGIDMHQAGARRLTQRPAFDLIEVVLPIRPLKGVVWPSLSLVRHEAEGWVAIYGPRHCERRRVTRGDVSILRPGCVVDMEWTGSGKVYLLHFAQAVLERGAVSAGRSASAMPRTQIVSRDVVLRGLYAYLLAEGLARWPNGDAFADWLGEVTLARFLEQELVDSEAILERGGLSPLQLSRVLDVMEAGVDSPLTLDDFANVAGLSRSHFCRRFAVTMGKTPGRYFTYKRLQRARALLMSGSHSVTDTALACGFDDLSSFTRSFKRAFGVPPSR